jgi:ribosomal protein S18 acetylase RimI-like enzyme
MDVNSGIRRWSRQKREAPRPTSPAPSPFEYRHVYDGDLSQEDRETLVRFLSTLDEELTHFKLTKERLEACFYLLLITSQDGSLVGIGGLERKLGFVRDLLMIHRESQGMGLGKILLTRLSAQARETSSMILCVVAEGNVPAIRLHESFGHLRIMKRSGLHYFAVPFSLKGHLLATLLMLARPAIFIVDLFRR